MKIKNYNIKITIDDEKMIDYLREEESINISNFIRRSIKDRYEEIKNARRNNSGNKADKASS